MGLAKESPTGIALRTGPTLLRAVDRNRQTCNLQIGLDCTDDTQTSIISFTPPGPQAEFLFVIFAFQNFQRQRTRTVQIKQKIAYVECNDLAWA
eukprot:1407717-Rhodomonas_salina.1